MQLQTKAKQHLAKNSLTHKDQLKTVLPSSAMSSVPLGKPMPDTLAVATAWTQYKSQGKTVQTSKQTNGQKGTIKHSTADRDRQ